MPLRIIHWILIATALCAVSSMQGQSVRTLYNAQQYERTADYLDRIDSLNGEEQAMVAYALLRLERFFLAEKAFLAAETRGQSTARFFHQFAQMYMARSEFPAALNKLNKALLIAPDDLSVMHDKAASLMQIEDWLEASFLLRKMLRIRPHHPQYTALLGTCYLEKEEPLKALKLYDAYLPKLEHSTYDRDILWDCARIARYRLGDLPKAEEYLLTLTRVFPDFWIGQQELVQLYNMRKKFFSAEAIRKQAAYAYKQGELPNAWMRSGYWMVDVLLLENHRIHVYASLFDDEEHPTFKLFILDINQQHIRGKIEVWPADNNTYALKLKTTLKSEERVCKDSEDYARLRSCIKQFARVLDGFEE